MKKLFSKFLPVVLTAMVSLAYVVCNGQTKTYRLFTKELDGTLWTIQVKDKKELTVINKSEDGTKAAALPMVSAATKNVYYVWDKRMKQFLVVNFTESDRLLNVVADKGFTTAKQVNDFVVDKRKLKAQKTYIAIEGITQEQAAKMSPITKIKPADIEALKKAVAAQKKEIDALFPSVNIMKEHPSVFMNSQQWLNMQCMLRGYKPPQNTEEYEFLTSRVN